MRSIEARFNKMTEKHPNYSSLICFGRAVWGQKMTRATISRWFNKLVDKTDYEALDRKALIMHLLLVTNMSEDDMF